MKLRTILFATLLAALAGAGLTWSIMSRHQHAHDAHEVADPAHSDHPAEGSRITHFTDRTELFVEFPPLVKGTVATFIAHLTNLPDFRPVGAGRVVVVLSGGAPEERFEAGPSTVPGIFKPEVRPQLAGRRALSLRWEEAGAGVVHELGEVVVFPDQSSAEATHHGREPAAEEGIAFTKERQWATDFATTAAVVRPMRDLVSATGVLRARSDGEAVLHAPATGHLLPGPRGFPSVGMPVRPGQVLARVAPHLGGDTDIASLELNLAKARLALERSRQERERMESLFRVEAVPERRLIAARSEEQAAEAERVAAEARLAHYRESPSSRARHGGLAIEAPIGGVVAEVSVVQGAFLAEGAPILRVVDPAHLWLEARVPESELGRLKLAQGGWFKVDGFEQTFDFTVGRNAKLVALGGVVEKDSRTVPVIFELDNPEGRLRIGMAAKVAISVGEAGESLAIPASAVVDEGGRNLVFVQLDGERFGRREVALGSRDGEWVAVRQGLEPGERVVSRGAYLVKLAGSVTATEGHGHAH